MFADVLRALDHLALDRVWCNVITTDGLDAYGELLTPSWDGDGRLVVEVGWAGVTVAEVTLDPAAFRAVLLRGDELGVFETDRAVLVGPVEPGHWTVPRVHGDALVFGRGDVLARLG